MLTAALSHTSEVHRVLRRWCPVHVGTRRTLANGGQRDEIEVEAYFERRGRLTQKPRDFQGAFPVHLLGIYSNQDLQASLGRLAKKLAAVRANGGPRRRPVSCRQRPRRPGWVLKAIVQVLADRGEPMQVKDIHEAVEALVGEPVLPPSVKGGLAKNVAGSSARFVRVARGRYILAR